MFLTWTGYQEERRDGRCSRYSRPFALFISTYLLLPFQPQPRITKLSNLCYTGAAARVIISLRGHYPLMRYLTQPDNCNICFYNREPFSFFLETSKLFAPRYNRARLIMLNNPGAKISSLLTFSASVLQCCICFFADCRPGLGGQVENSDKRITSDKIKDPWKYSFCQICYLTIDTIWNCYKFV